MLDGEGEVPQAHVERPSDGLNGEILAVPLGPSRHGPSARSHAVTCMQLTLCRFRAAQAGVKPQNYQLATAVILYSEFIASHPKVVADGNARRRAADLGAVRKEV
jgi:hypothetical protein